VITLICIVLIIIKNNNTKFNESKLDVKNASTKQESITGQNDINNTLATSIETKDEENKNTEDKDNEETKEKVNENTEDKKIENTQEKTTSKVTKETSGTVVKNVESTSTVPTKNEEPAPQPQQVVEPEPQKPVEEPKVEIKKIDLSKYDYYENSLNGSYKGFIRDDAEMSKLKSLIDTCIKEFGYTNVKIVQDSSLAQSGARSFTANKTNVENAIYDSDGFTICYYAVKEYHISSDGTESLFQTRSYIKVR
ncbi:MAG: hypothetical protein K6B70_03395, partial [Clostridia bacterium]|nr:hypothetical protein [Clostridia bacterium]